MDELLQKYYETKQKVDDYNEKLEKYKKQILKQLDKDASFKNDTYQLKLKSTKNERINKSDCPKDIWEKYKKTSVYQSFDLKKIKDNINGKIYS
jgi:hypothetical protein